MDRVGLLWDRVGFLSVFANMSLLLGDVDKRWCFQRPIILHPFNHYQSVNDHFQHFDLHLNIFLHSQHSERPHLVSGVVGAALSAKRRAVQDGAEVPLGRM